MFNRITIIIIIFAKIKVTLSHKCCRGTVHKSLSQVGYWSNVSYTAAATAQLGLCSVVLKKRIEQQRLQIAPECQIWRQRSDGCRYWVPVAHSAQKWQFMLNKYDVCKIKFSHFTTLLRSFKVFFLQMQLHILWWEYLMLSVNILCDQPLSSARRWPMWQIRFI